MTRTVKVLTDYAMKDLKMHRVVIKAAPENNASVSVAERLSFTREALLHDEHYLINRYYDTVVYAKINSQTK